MHQYGKPIFLAISPYLMPAKFSRYTVYGTCLQCDISEVHVTGVELTNDGVSDTHTFYYVGVGQFFDPSLNVIILRLVLQSEVEAIEPSGSEFDLGQDVVSDTNSI